MRCPNAVQKHFVENSLEMDHLFYMSFLMIRLAVATVTVATANLPPRFHPKRISGSNPLSEPRCGQILGYFSLVTRPLV